MTYQVVVSQHAKDDLRHYYNMAAQRAPETAIRRLDRFESSLQALSVRPERCPIAPEDDLVERTIRQFYVWERRRKISRALRDSR